MVQVVLSSGEKQLRGDAIQHDANGCDDHYGFPADFGGIGKTTDRFPTDAAHRDH